MSASSQRAPEESDINDFQLDSQALLSHHQHIHGHHGHHTHGKGGPKLRSPSALLARTRDDTDPSDREFDDDDDSENGDGNRGADLPELSSVSMHTPRAGPRQPAVALTALPHLDEDAVGAGVIGVNAPILVLDPPVSELRRGPSQGSTPSAAPSSPAVSPGLCPLEPAAPAIASPRGYARRPSQQHQRRLSLRGPTDDPSLSQMAQAAQDAQATQDAQSEPQDSPQQPQQPQFQPPAHYKAQGFSRHGSQSSLIDSGRPSNANRFNTLTPIVSDHVYTPAEARSAGEREKQLLAMQSAFHRMKIIRDPLLDALNPELREACSAFRQALLLRRRFVFTPKWGPRPERNIEVAPVYRSPIELAKVNPMPEEFKLTTHGYRMGDDGVFRAWKLTDPVNNPDEPMSEAGCAPYSAPSVREFSTAFSDVMQIIHHGPCKTEAHKRLHILESRFGLHVFMNNAAETMCQKLVPHRDFYNVRKVDNHVHHSACMNQKHLLRFIKHKFKVARRKALAKAAREQQQQLLQASSASPEAASSGSAAGGANQVDQAAVVVAEEKQQQQQQQQQLVEAGQQPQQLASHARGLSHSFSQHTLPHHHTMYYHSRINSALSGEDDGEEEEIVIVCDGRPMTLVQVFESLKISAYDLNVDALDMSATNSFQRFDRFNLKYNPLGESRLREIFLKYDNHIKGKYLAEVTQQVMDDLEMNKYSFMEWRLSIYGRDRREWANLADWVVDHNLFHPNVRWMIQIPRLYRVYRSQGRLDNLQQMLENIFEPLFEVSANPSANPKLHMFLQQVVGFDSVDDESLRELSFDMQNPDDLPAPKDWVQARDPPYALFSYYLYANLLALNKLRESKGLTTFAYRPHAGEAGSIEHLVVTFLMARSINHGLKLQRSPALQYLYYLSQIGLSMSPLSNNMLFCDYDKNPFPRFFKRGLNVALSTDDPLMIHVTKEPLVEEYGVAAQVWKLSPIDMCELARNSVLQSGFEHKFKAHWIGNNYWKRSVEGNDIRCTNVPNIRVQFRAELLREEIQFLADGSGLPINFDEVVDELG